ncbi:MAG: glutaredoxin family protein [Gammaproteobacteria bacterium]|nr:glutaredoxin family protein [Gammaproteobacteria bacterium]MDH5652605.1 glutaredoxin family protein [Gammaproteobacteria bacterium]
MTRQLTVYHRTGCHLCEDMIAQLLALQQQFGFSLQQLDIQDDPELEAAYGTKVPVLLADGHEICHYFLDQVALSRYFGTG